MGWGIMAAVDSVDVRALALEAALAELQQWGVDRFTIEGVAHRSHLDPAFLRAEWDNERQLILDALSSYSELTITAPDTGSLHGDLTALALSLADYLNEPVGRRIARMLVIDSKSQAADVHTRAAFYAMRREVVTVIFRRAAERGELREDVNPGVALQMLTAPLHSYALYTDAQIAHEYCHVLADLVARAITED